MNHLFVLYQEALELKNLGFDEPCFGFYYKDITTPSVDYWNTPNNNLCKNSNLDKNIVAPLYSQVFDWFREKHGIMCVIMDFIDDEIGVEWDYSIHKIGTDVDENGNWIPLVDYSTNDPQRKFKTYENTQLACLQKLIEICKNDNTTRS